MTDNAIEEVLKAEAVAREKIKSAQQEHDLIVTRAEQEAKKAREEIINLANSKAQEIIDEARQKGTDLSKNIRLEAENTVAELENISEDRIQIAVKFIEKKVAEYGNR